MSFFRKLHQTPFVPVSDFSFFKVMKQELLTPLGVLRVYFYTVRFHHQSYGHGSVPAHTLSENKGMNCELKKKKSQENIKFLDIEVIGFVTSE